MTEGLSQSKKVGISLCCAVLIIFIILGTLSFLGRKKELFSMPGDYPRSVDGGILSPPYGNYPQYKKGPCTPGVSDYNYSTAWKLQPPVPVGSYAQVTNNKEYWSSPCNGTSTPAEICGGLYKNKKINKKSLIKCPPISPKRGVRVGFYVSDV